MKSIHPSFRAVSIAALVLFSNAACGGDAAPTAPTRAPFVRDDQGRALVLHGLNVDNHAKSSPGRVHDISEAEIAMIADDWGFNFVRLLVLWDQAEPSPGVYDEAYFDMLEGRLDQFHAEHVHVLLDMHQDVYAARFCCDGAPEWAIRDDGLPFELQSLWALNYLQPAVQRAFDNFWAYEDGAHADLQDHYGDLWARVAERLGGHPAVVGYDLMNEPHPGTDFDVLEAIARIEPEDGGSSRRFDETKLGPFYQRMIDRIRRVDQDAYVFVESRYGAPGNGSPSYLPTLRDPRAGEDRIVYAPHLYSVTIEAGGAYADDDPTIAFWEARRREELARQPMPLVLGEWGLDANVDGALRYAGEVFDTADRMMAGWAYWSWDPAGGWAFWQRATDTEGPHLDLAIRTYPRAVAGDPIAYRYDADTHVFTLTFHDREGVTGPTEIYVPSRHYPDGVNVRATDASGTWSYVPSADMHDVLLVTTPFTGGPHTITITPRDP